MAVSTNYGLYLPTREDYISVKRDISDNFEKVDAVMKENADGIAGIAIVCDGDTAPQAITAGQYLFIKNHTTLATGGYHATANIALGAALTSSNTAADTDGIANALNSNFTKEILTFTKANTCPTVYTEPTLYKMSNIIFFDAVFNGTVPTTQTNVLGTVPSDCRPPHNIAGTVTVTDGGTGAIKGYGALRIATNGTVELAVSASGFVQCFACYVL